jgi:hypothetical protein
MSITETLQGLGSWSAQFQDIPQDLLDKIQYFGHVAVHVGRVDYRTEGDSALSSSRYTGVVRKKTGDGNLLTVGGPGMAMWLGDEDQKGAVIETLLTFNTQTFQNTVRGLLPTSGAITEGTIYNLASTFSGSFQYVSPREAINYVTSTLNAVWRVNGDGTLDAGLETDLFVTLPKTVVSRKEQGTDMVLRALLGSLSTNQDVEDFTTRVLLLAQGDGASTVTADADINPGLNPYKDVHGNIAAFTRLVSESTTDSTNADARAQLQLNRFSGTRNALTMSSSDYDIRGDVKVGDYIWVHDPELGVVDIANEVVFRGKLIYPMKLQLTEMTTPLDTRMSIGYRDWNGVWYNLSDYFVVESGDSTLVVGGYNRSLVSGDGGTAGSRPVADTSIPGIPTWVTPFQMSVYQSPVNGDTKAQVMLEWTRPNNTDGSSIADGDHYEIRWRNSSTPLFPVRWADLTTYRWGDVKASGGTWAEPIQYTIGDWHYTAVPFDSLKFLMQELTSNMPYEAQIRAVDGWTPPNAGSWSTLTAFQTLGDTYPPATPAPPSVAASKLAIQVTHLLGRSDSGTFNLDLDLHHLEVHGSYEPNFNPDDSTLVGKMIANAGMITGQVPVVQSFNIDKLFPVYFKVIAVDNAGNKSSPSSAAQATAELIDDAHITDLTVSKVTAGTISADWLIGANIRTGTSGARVGLYSGGLYTYNDNNDLTFLINGFNGDVYSGGNLTLDGNIQMPGAVRVFDGFQIQAELGLLSDSTYGLALRNGSNQLLRLQDFVFGPTYQYIGGSEGTLSTSYTNLGTFGPSATVYIGATRRCMVLISAYVTVYNAMALMTFQVSGASSISSTSALTAYSDVGSTDCGVTVLEATQIDFLDASVGLNQGYNTFTAKYAATNQRSSPSATWAGRRITVLPY